MPADTNAVQHAVFDSADLPRMTSEQDFALLARVLSGHGPFDTIVEFGPWLGALSVRLAPAGDLHVVDNFVWTKDHDKRVPRLHAAGESFQPTFERLLAARGLSATAHCADFADFTWDGPPVALCVIDGPKQPDGLLDCLRAVQPGLAQDALVVIKNAHNVQYLPMMRYLDRLVSDGAFALESDLVDPQSNILVFRALRTGDALAARLQAVPIQDPDTDDDADSLVRRLPQFQLADILERVRRGDWRGAYATLSAMTTDKSLIKPWNKVVPDLLDDGVDETRLGWFTDILSLHHDAAKVEKPPKSFKASVDKTFAAYWINNADKPWRGRAFDPEILERAFDYGYMRWPDAMKDFVKGKTILDVGCGPGLHGLGYIVAGAERVLGIDPIVKPDKDRVKNLAAKSAKMPFGWTLNEISERVGPWNVQADPIQALPESEKYDLAMMHNVTEHLLQIEDVFDAIARRLKPGGKLIYNHHNFYSWNGHHLPPKTVAAIKLDDPKQREMIDWGHVDYDPDPEHYIARGLNRITLDRIIALTERHFDIEIADERPSRPETGLGRLNDAIRARYPRLTDRDFETQNLFCVATLKAG